MAPKASNDHPTKDDEGSRQAGLDPEDDGPGEDRDVESTEPPPMGLCRQMCLCAGLMASDGGLVFLQLAMVPCLQTLGVPVSLVTVAGVISGSLALMGLPLMGWVSDGGTNPHRRKKPAVVLSAMLFVTGYLLLIAGCALRLDTADQHSSGTIPPNSTNLTRTYNVDSSSFHESHHHSFEHTAPIFRSRENFGTANTKNQTPEGPGFSENSDSESSEPSLGTMHVSTKNSSNISEADDWISVDPLGLGIPLTGLLGIVGFVFMDMGNDFNNACLKSFVLTCTSRRQHNSLFVVGVLMSALGGCVAAVLGVLDIAALLLDGYDLEAVPTKTLLLAAFFLVVTIVCMLVTLLSAPPFLPVTKTSSSSSDLSLSKPLGCETGKEDFPKPRVTDDAQISLNQSLINNIVPKGDDNYDQTLSGGDGASGRTSSSNSVCGACPQTEGEKNSSSVPVHSGNLPGLLADTREAERQPFLRSCDTTQCQDSVSHAGKPATNMVVILKDPSVGSVECAVTDDTTLPYDFKGTKKCVQENPPGLGKPQQPPDTHQYSPVLKWGLFSIKRTTLKMIPVCVSMFFMAGAWQSFNICATDYLGKIVYGGDPDAGGHSRSYAAYQQGIRTGSLGVLMLNVAYVAVNLLQKKILALIGPKAEYLTVCVVQAGVLLSLQLTDEVELFYTAAVVYGLFRSVMYTVPFMLANTICQQAVTSETDKGSAKVGSTMALMTAMMPLSYVLVSTITGPLIHATGDPAAPLYYAFVTTLLAAFVFAFT